MNGIAKRTAVLYAKLLCLLIVVYQNIQWGTLQRTMGFMVVLGIMEGLRNTLRQRPLHTNHWKPESETLKVNYGVKIQHGQQLDPGQAAF